MADTNEILKSIDGFNDLDPKTRWNLEFNSHSLYQTFKSNSTPNQAVKRALKKEIFDKLEDLDLNSLLNLVKISKNDSINNIRNQM